MATTAERVRASAWPGATRWRQPTHASERIERSSRGRSRWKEICATALLCGAAAVISPAQTFTTLVNLNGTDGANPVASLVQGTDGNLYGLASGGGNPLCGSPYGCGTVFRVTLIGKLSIVHNFVSVSTQPSGLTLGTDENLYGENSGGSSGGCGGGCGAIYRLSPEGTFTWLDKLQLNEGHSPSGTLVQATDGNYYGATRGGPGGNGFGTVFRMTPNGTLTTLHTFSGNDGASPGAGLVQANDGNLYGTTTGGGAHGFGTVFRISLGGALTTLHNFGGYPADGASPGGLLQDTDGSFYGTAGGGANNEGVIFKFTQNGKLTILHSFDGTDGAYPGGMVEATDGNLYGTTSSGGASGDGTIFEITPEGALATLHSFDGFDGSDPGGLVQDTNGTLYGPTHEGGANDSCSGACGTVFSLDVGLGPFVTTLPTSRPGGQRVAILGNNLTGATSVTFNGTPATFTVVSSTEISTTVPSGATTGTVQVVTPAGTLSSNLPFTVRP